MGTVDRHQSSDNTTAKRVAFTSPKRDGDDEKEAEKNAVALL